MGSRSQSEDQSTLDPITPAKYRGLCHSEVLATLAAAAEAGDQIASQEAGVTRADGKQQGSRKRLISLVDDTDDSDVEISQPTQKTKPRRQTMVTRAACSVGVMLHSFASSPRTACRPVQLGDAGLGGFL
ncbi:hypothetical protein Bca52824_050896 [Brassica carinata]|uniref:Uncharacterized protein n=1 Tax=Brassica carinata TaxID=52824 RepID=A0A8X7UJA4_BRACI|nr:hypothetical protein Bca52824_050896 [Brassica carinata]